MTIPSSESGFIEGLNESSAVLSASLEQIEINTEGVMSAKQQAMVLEKLVAAREADEEIPEGS